jgi:hypothetical protein
MNRPERYQGLSRRSQEGRLDAPDIRVVGPAPYRYAATIVSPTFEGMDDDDRRVPAWRAVLDHTGEEDRRWIEFLHTYSPAEMAAFAEADGPTVEKG